MRSGNITALVKSREILTKGEYKTVLLINNFYTKKTGTFVVRVNAVFG